MWVSVPLFHGLYAEYAAREREREIERKIERSMIEIYLSLGWEHRTQRKDKTKTESEGRAR